MEPLLTIEATKIKAIITRMRGTDILIYGT